MSVVSVRERHQSRRSSYKDGRLSHTREWLVRCDDPQDGTAVALTANDGTRRIPPIQAGHPKDSAAKLTGLDASPHENSDILFLVSGTYESTGPIGLPQNPIERAPEISFSFTDGTEEYFRDFTSPEPKRVTNSAGDPFEAYLERETGELVIQITSNEESFNVVDMDALKHTTNLNAVVIDGVTYAEGTLKLSPPSAQKVTETVEAEGGAISTFTYYRVSWVVKARKGGWKDKLLDVGLNELIADVDPVKPPRLRPIVDAANLTIKRPWPLNGAGRKKHSYTDKPAEVEFVPYLPAAWSWRWTKPDAWAS